MFSHTKHWIVQLVFQISFTVIIGENHYSFFGRKVENEKGIELLNIWKNGFFQFKYPIFPKTRLQNMHQRVLKTSSWEAEPFVYVDQDQQFTGGYEVCTVRAQIVVAL